MEHRQQWAKRSGLLDWPGEPPRLIGWDFPFVSKGQQEQFGLRGYVAAWLLPDGFEPACNRAEVAWMEADHYARLTITDPHSDSFGKIPPVYQTLMDYAKTKSWENRYAFEEEYERDGVPYMDIYLQMN